MDFLALLFSILGGFFMGSYPVPIKAPAVVQANVNPLIFQAYKSFWVFMTGWIFLITRAAGARKEDGPLFAFSWWGVASAAGWIPSGLGTIASVQMLGVGMAIVINTGTSALLSFLVFWLVLGEKMKKHTSSSGDYYLAPVWLIVILIGMAGLVFSPRLRLPCAGADDDFDDEEEDEGPTVEDTRSSSHTRRSRLRTNESVGLLDARKVIPAQAYSVVTTETEHFGGGRRRLLGLVAALFAGIFSAVQFGVVNAGKEYEQNRESCRHCTDACSDDLKEKFDNFGSWMASFGIGAALVTLALLAVYAVYLKAKGLPPPDPHFRTLRLPGSIAGICWAIGAFFQTAAVVRGGSATMMPANLACQLVTSGLWGIFWYREVRGWHAVVWGLFALVTLAAMVLLGQEKDGTKDNDQCPPAYS